jgi:hypothetical protein
MNLTSNALISFILVSNWIGVFLWELF